MSAIYVALASLSFNRLAETRFVPENARQPRQVTTEHEMLGIGQSFPGYSLPASFQRPGECVRIPRSIRIWGGGGVKPFLWVFFFFGG